MKLILELVLWYNILGCIAIFARLRKSYLIRKDTHYHECTGPLDYLRFEKELLFPWLIQTIFHFFHDVAIWPSLLEAPPTEIWLSNGRIFWE